MQFSVQSTNTPHSVLMKSIKLTMKIKLPTAIKVVTRSLTHVDWIAKETNPLITLASKKNNFTLLSIILLRCLINRSNDNRSSLAAADFSQAYKTQARSILMKRAACVRGAHERAILLLLITSFSTVSPLGRRSPSFYLFFH